MLVEDVDVNRDIIIALLEDTHIEIDIAENGQMTVDKFFCDQNKYDLVFMDIHMPINDHIAEPVDFSVMLENMSKYLS